MSPSWFIGQAIVGATPLAQAAALEFDPMGTVDDAIDDSVPYRQIADHVVPAVQGHLAGNKQRALVIAVIDDLQQVPALLGVQRFRPPIVDDEQADALQGRQHPG